MVHVIDQVYEAGRDDILNSYIKVNSKVANKGKVLNRILHSESVAIQLPLKIVDLTHCQNGNVHSPSVIFSHGHFVMTFLDI